MPRAIIGDRKRMNLRVSSEAKAKLIRAAALHETDLTGFVTQTALHEAEAVIEATDVIRLSAEEMLSPIVSRLYLVLRDMAERAVDQSPLGGKPLIEQGRKRRSPAVRHVTPPKLGASIKLANRGLAQWPGRATPRKDVSPLAGQAVHGAQDLEGLRASASETSGNTPKVSSFALPQ